MSFDPNNQAPKKEGGLFGKRFQRPVEVEAESWSLGEIGIVDADAATPPTTRATTPASPVWDVPPERTTPARDVPPENTPPMWNVPPGSRRSTSSAPLFTSAPPNQDAQQALWEVIPSRQSQQTNLAVLGQSLSTAFYPIQPAVSFWRRLFGLSASPKSQQSEVISLELIGSSQGARFFLRGSLPLVTRVFDHLLASYGTIERAALEPDAGADPLTPQLGEGVSFAELYLTHPAALPLKVPGPASLTEGLDPLAAVMQTCNDPFVRAQGGLRLASQLVITQAPTNWQGRYKSLLQKQPGQQATSSAEEMQQAALAALFLGGVIAALLVIHGLIPLLLVLLSCLLLVGSFFLSKIFRRALLTGRMLRNQQEVTNKLSQAVVRTRLRLYVLGPADQPQGCDMALDRLIAAYGAYKGANSWKVGRRGRIGSAPLARPGLDRFTGAGPRFGPALDQSAGEYQAMKLLPLAFRPASRWQRLMLRMGGDQARPVLGMNEVAALWHLWNTERIPKDDTSKSIWDEET